MKCYAGSKGIPEGKKWCQFTNTWTWENVLNRAKEKNIDVPEAQCEEKADVLGVGAKSTKKHGEKHGGRNSARSGSIPAAMCLAVSLSAILFPRSCLVP